MIFARWSSFAKWTALLFTSLSSFACAHHGHHHCHGGAEGHLSDLQMPLPAAMATLKVTSKAFSSEQPISLTHVFDQFGCQGQNVSPDIAWSNVPEGVKSFALVIHDPDAPTGVGFFHWLLWDIPADTTSLPEGATKQLPLGTIQGHNDASIQHYAGPCPPPGTPHRYNATIFALDVPSLGLPNGATGAMLRFALRAHILAYGTVTGHYQQ